MKCKYTFRLTGQIKVAELRPIDIHGWTFEFLQEGDLLSHLSVTIPANGPNDVPTVVPNPSPGANAQINIPAPGFVFVRQEVWAFDGGYCTQ